MEDGFQKQFNCYCYKYSEFERENFLRIISQDRFLSGQGKQFKGVFIDTKKPNTKYTFENLADGQYAVAIFHDENENGIIDKNMFGAPTEAYGFSRNARGTFSAPSFEEAKIDLKENKSIEIWIK